MPGLITFPTLAEAVRAGFYVHNRTPDGYIVRVRSLTGWTFAQVTSL